MGTRRLEFQPYEKAIIMLSMIYFPNLNAADSYMSFSVRVLSRLPFMTSLGYPSTNMDGLSTMADIFLQEKVNACTFHTVFVSELGKSPLCDACVGNVLVDSRLYRRKKVDVASSPVPVSAVLAVPPLPLIEPIPQLSPVCHPEDVFVHGQSRSVFSAMPPLPFKGKSSYIGFPPRTPHRAIKTTTEDPPPKEEAPESLAGSERSVKSSQLQGAQDMYVLANDFEAFLISNFGCIEYAFDYMDSSRGARRGKLSKTTFIYACDSLKFVAGDVSTLFSFLDIKSDGVLDLEELMQWRAFRTQYIKRLEMARPSDSVSEAFFNIDR